jgi:hypothetical protein
MSMTRIFCETKEKKNMLMEYTQVVRKWHDESNTRFKPLTNWDKYFGLEQYQRDIKREKSNFNGVPH